MSLPFFVPEVGMFRAAGKDEKIVGVIARFGVHGVLIESDFTNTFSENSNVSCSGQDGPDRCGDFGWAEASGCDLIKEWLEEMVIALIEKGDLDVGRSGESLGGIESGEPAADDHDSLRHKGRVHARLAERAL